MLLAGKNAVIYGAGGAIGGAVARAFADAGATIHLVGRSVAKLEATADAIAKQRDARGRVGSVASVDVLDAIAVRDHAARIAEAGPGRGGGIDIAFQGVGFMHVQGTPLASLSFEDFALPIEKYMRAHFGIVKAVAPSMIARRSGVFLFLSTPAARISFPGVLGFGTTCAAIEGFNRHLAAELGPHGVRTICLRPDALPEAVTRGSHARDVFRPVAAKMGTTVEEMLAQPSPSLLGRYGTLADVANAAVFAASSHAAAMTGTTLNLTCGGTD